MSEPGQQAALQKVFDEADTASQRGGFDAAAALYVHALTRWSDQPLRRVTQTAPGFAYAHHMLGQCWQRLQRPDDATVAFRNALQADARLLMSRLALARHGARIRADDEALGRALIGAAQWPASSSRF